MDCKQPQQPPSSSQSSMQQQQQKSSNVPTRTRNIRKYYRMIAEVGSGTYGRVYKAECLRTHEYVALKKFESKDEKVKEDGFPITAVREIRLLKQLDHSNVIKLREIVLSKASERNDFRGSTFLVFDYMDHDFAGLHRNKHEFSLPELKCVMLQILLGVQYLHMKKIIHRDLKIANILYNNQGEVKIADFGLARMLNPSNPKYTNKVVTLWYRAPEILLGAKEYTQQIDMWSVGCIFIELAVRENLLRGETEARQLEKIYELCGSTGPVQWPEVDKLQHWKDLKPKKVQERKLREMLLERRKNLDAELLNLIDGIMVLNPKKRMTVSQCIDHPFFKVEPLPLKPHEMPKIKEECHEALLKNVKSMNQVIYQKSNFTQRQNVSPSRLQPKAYQPSLTTHQNLQRHASFQQSSTSSQSSTSQIIGFKQNTNSYSQLQMNKSNSVGGSTSVNQYGQQANNSWNKQGRNNSSGGGGSGQQNANSFSKKQSMDMGSNSHNPSSDMDHNSNRPGENMSQIKVKEFNAGLASLLGKQGGGTNDDYSTLDKYETSPSKKRKEHMEEEDNTKFQAQSQSSKRSNNPLEMLALGGGGGTGMNQQNQFMQSKSYGSGGNNINHRHQRGGGHSPDDFDIPLKKKIKEE